MRRWRRAKQVQVEAQEPEPIGTLVVTLDFDGYTRPLAEALADSLPRFIGKSADWSGIEVKLKQRATPYGEVIDHGDPPLIIDMQAPGGADTTSAEIIAKAEAKRIQRGFD